jgi:NADH-quinone oxidoreductase subunit A
MPDLVFYLLVFLGVGSFFLFIHLYMGFFIRPNRPDTEKLTIYECGEPTVGSAWVQFDLRYYVVALLFVIFDVEVAFFFPWAVVFGTMLDVSHEPSAETRAILMKTLDPAPKLPPLPGEADAGVIGQETAKSWAWVAFMDILVFFGVLMMGFAYLWRRGDLNWVRAVVPAEQGEAMEAEIAPESRSWAEPIAVEAAGH